MYSDEFVPAIRLSSEVIALYVQAGRLFEYEDSYSFNRVVQEICNKTELSPAEVKYNVIIKIYPELDL